MVKEDSDIMGRRKLKIDLSELTDAIEHGSSYEVEYYLNAESGEVVMVADEALTGIEPPEIDDRFVLIPPVASHEGYQDMEDFITTVEDQTLQKLLWVAIDGKGAFRRFKNVLYDHPEVRERWFVFEDARMRQRVLEWLDDEGIELID
jgi:hypothetical protein